MVVYSLRLANLKILGAHLSGVVVHQNVGNKLRHVVRHKGTAVSAEQTRQNGANVSGQKTDNFRLGGTIAQLFLGGIDDQTADGAFNGVSSGLELEHELRLDDNTNSRLKIEHELGLDDNRGSAGRAHMNVGANDASGVALLELCSNDGSVFINQSSAFGLQKGRKESAHGRVEKGLNLSERRVAIEFVFSISDNESTDGASNSLGMRLVGGDELHQRLRHDIHVSNGGHELGQRLGSRNELHQRLSHDIHVGDRSDQFDKGLVGGNELHQRLAVDVHISNGRNEFRKRASSLADALAHLSGGQRVIGRIQKGIKVAVQDGLAL